MLPRSRSLVAALGLICSPGCGLGPLTPNIQIESCAQEVLKIQTRDCCCAGCENSIRVPVDVSVSPPVARMKVGTTGFLELATAANDVPKGCLPRGIGDLAPAAEWATTNPAVLGLSPRFVDGRAAPHSMFVRALAPGEAAVFAQVEGVGKVDFAYCPQTLGGFQRLDSCVEVRGIVVTP